jgi:hypothetical protein
MRPACGTALTLGIGLSFGGMAPSAEAQRPQVAPCHVQQGQRGVYEDRSVALGNMTIRSCARAIQAASGIGTLGLYEIEVDSDGRVLVNGEEIGILRTTPDDEPSEGRGSRRG